MIKNPAQRFSGRVENYAKYRPGYPSGTLDILRNHCRLSSDSVIADIGSGTGIFSELLLKNGNQVFGIEPNDEMRVAAEQSLASYQNFSSIKGTAESTTLSDQSVTFITAAQAFHWFDRTTTLAEFMRILQPEGWVVLIWNVRRPDSTPFLRSYEHLLRTHGTDYLAVSDQHPNLAQVQAFFGTAPVSRYSLESHQRFDWEGLLGRLLSSSYAPPPGDPNFEPMHRELREAFDRFQEEGMVCFDYDTVLYCVQPGLGAGQTNS